MPMEDTYGIQSRIGSIIVVERWYCCRGSPVFSDRNIQQVCDISKFLNDSLLLMPVKDMIKEIQENHFIVRFL